MCNGRNHPDKSEEEYKEFCKGHQEVLVFVEALLNDFFLDCKPLYKYADYTRDLKTIRKSFSCNGLVFVTKTLPAMFQGVLTYLETGETSYPLRCKRGKTYPKLFSGIFRLIYSGTCDDVTMVKIMGWLYQVCVAFKKLKGPYTNDVLKTQLFKLRWVDGELYRDCLNDPDMTSIIAKARTLANELFAGINDENLKEFLIPRPGPGATNTPTQKAERYRAHRLYHQIEKLMPTNEWHQPTVAKPFTYFDFYVGLKPVLDPDNKGILNLAYCAEPTSRFKFVHKEFGKPRGICIEELEMQWRQQALRRFLYHHCEHHPLTKGYVGFVDQSVNGLLALEASKRDALLYYRLTTMDMNDASNRVSRNLVWDIFHEAPIYKYLDALSTRYIRLPNGKTMKCNMFAPMGSAICFPVMALCHYFLIKAIISHTSPLHIKDTRVWVYGDDILFPIEHTEHIYKWLPKFGMKINKDKSYCRSFFRESCGTNAYLGVDITPVRIKSILNSSLSGSVLAATLKNEEAFTKRNCHVTAKLIRLRTHKLLGRELPFVGPKSPVLGWKRPSTDPFVERYIPPRKRWVPDWQVWHYKACTLVKRLADAPPLSDCELYLRKQVESPEFANKIDGEPLDRDIAIVWRWLPISSFRN